MNEYTLTDIIVAFLGSAHNTGTFNRLLTEKSIKRHTKQTVRTTLYRMEKQGFVVHTKDEWKLTLEGAARKKTERLMDYIPSPFGTKSKKQTIVAFDIPETKRHARRWLRNQLKVFSYTMLQRSLWRGPGPLPKNFTKRLRQLKIEKEVMTFTIVSVG